MKHIAIIAALMTLAACGSSAQEQTNTSNSAVCPWVAPNYSFRTYSNNTTQLVPLPTEGQYWEINGVTDSQKFTLFVTVDGFNVPWVTLYTANGAEAWPCADMVDVGNSQVIIKSLNNGTLTVEIRNADNSVSTIGATQAAHQPQN